jgi:hypothetical protein
VQPACAGPKEGVVGHRHSGRTTELRWLLLDPRAEQTGCFGTSLDRGVKKLQRGVRLSGVRTDQPGRPVRRVQLFHNLRQLSDVPG